jgi:hypothetical protein
MQTAVKQAGKPAACNGISVKGAKNTSRKNIAIQLVKLVSSPWYQN